VGEGLGDDGDGDDGDGEDGDGDGEDRDGDAGGDFVTCAGVRAGDSVRVRVTVGAGRGVASGVVLACSGATAGMARESLVLPRDRPLCVMGWAVGPDRPAARACDV
jgi:hypothetical protein